MSPLSLKTLSILRMAIGAGCLAIPRQVGPLFGIAIPPETVVVSRLMGIREFVIGAYLWKRTREWQNARKDLVYSGADKAPLLPKSSVIDQPTVAEPTVVNATPTVAASHNTPAHNNHSVDSNLRSAIWLGLVVDGMDMVIVLAGALEGTLSSMAQVNLGIAAVLAAAIGGEHLLRMGNKESSHGQ